MTDVKTEAGYINCPRCNGTGRFVAVSFGETRCNECVGAGKVRADKYDPKYYR